MGLSKGYFIERILKSGEELYDMLIPSLPLERMASDVTIAQLRILLVLRAGGAISMSEIASAVGVVPSTATGIVDNLVTKGLVLRDDDPRDRRRVICRLSPEGQQIVSGLWTWGRSQIERLMQGLTVAQLRSASEVTEALRDNAAKLL